MAYTQKGWEPYTKASPLKGLKDWLGLTPEAKQKRQANKAWKKKSRELDKLGSMPWNKPFWQSDYQKGRAKKGITTQGYLDAKYRRKGKKSYAPGGDLHGPLTDWTGTSSDPIPNSGDKSRRARKELVRDKMHKDARHYSSGGSSTPKPGKYAREYIKSKFSRSTRDYKRKLKDQGYK